MRGMRRWIPWVLVAVLMLATAAVLWNRLAPGPRDQRFDREVRAAARLYGVDPALIKAVIWKESTFNPSARGKVGEIGLMQLREPAAVEWSTSEGVSGLSWNIC
jgi:soluble lytic murein transglycosylase